MKTKQLTLKILTLIMVMGNNFMTMESKSDQNFITQEFQNSSQDQVSSIQSSGLIHGQILNSDPQTIIVQNSSQDQVFSIQNSGLIHGQILNSDPQTIIFENSSQDQVSSIQNSGLIELQKLVKKSSSEIQDSTETPFSMEDQGNIQDQFTPTQNAKKEEEKSLYIKSEMNSQGNFETRNSNPQSMIAGITQRVQRDKETGEIRFHQSQRYISSQNNTTYSYSIKRASLMGKSNLSKK
jgi:hypothetical protein